MTDTLAPVRRPCRQCAGTGLFRSPMGGSAYDCPRCHGSGTVAPLGHFDAAEVGSDYWPDDGCGPGHAYVVNPCVVCGKAPLDARHACTTIEREKPCEHRGRHHAHQAGATEPSTREGCREHGVTFEDVLHWQQVALERGAHTGLCWCCLSPSPVESGGIPREFCYRCLPRETAVAA